MKVVLFAAQSLDGRISRHDEAGDAFTSEADKRHFRAEIRACDACVMGGRTYALSKERMRPEAFPALRRVVWTRRPEAHAAAAVPGVLEFTREAPAETVARLRADGRRRCALLGGGQVYAAWLAAGLVDELCVTLESRIFGFGTGLVAAVSEGPEGRAASAEQALRGPALDVRLGLLETRLLAEGGPLLLRYSVTR
jgi:riboflavin biosynthesis pyrimidine reductase